MEAATNMKIYLEYASMLDGRDPIMALYFRMYYAQEFLKSIRKVSGNGIDRNSSIALNAVFKKIESAKRTLSLTASEREEHVKGYCRDMYVRVVATAKDPKSDKGLSVRKLSTMIDFIQVLTTFGELAPDWVSKRILRIYTNRKHVHSYDEGA